MSVREEIAQAVAEDLCSSFHHQGYDGVWTGDDGVTKSYAVDGGPCREHRIAADAAAVRALAIVRAHRDRLADELEAEAHRMLEGLKHRPNLTQSAIATELTYTARRVRALYEEQPK